MATRRSEVDQIAQQATGHAILEASATPSSDGGLGRALLQRKLASRLQRRAAEGGGALNADEAHAAAARGLEGPAQALPHADAIQRSFGHHDVRDTAAHVGGAAAAAAGELGARAFAYGGAVGFEGAPDLHTAAHEAAHVVQQREGVHLADGVGAEGDTFEQHADAVADKVARGESATALLDAVAPRGRTAGAAVASTPGVQLAKKKKKKTQPAIDFSKLQTFNLEGEYGKYIVAMRLESASESGDYPRLDTRIEMQPNEKTKDSKKIAFLQVVRRSKEGGAWGTKDGEEGVNKEREHRTEQEGGWRVDSQLDDKKEVTPFYGLNKDDTDNPNDKDHDQIPEGQRKGARAETGHYGGDNPWMEDAPGLYPEREVEFLSTAMDVTSGRKFDAVAWGAKMDVNGKLSDAVPKLEKADGERAAGRDRAIDRWNDHAAPKYENAGKPVAHVPEEPTPKELVDFIVEQMNGDETFREVRLFHTLGRMRNTELIQKTADEYKKRTGKVLADDLRASVSDGIEKSLWRWL